jgi:hypothetical protein
MLLPLLYPLLLLLLRLLHLEVQVLLVCLMFLQQWLPAAAPPDQVYIF